MTEAVEAVGMCQNDNSGVWGPGWRLKWSPRVTGAAFLPAMVGGRLQAFWKHGVQVWALGSDQVSSFLLAPARPSHVNHLTHQIHWENKLTQGVKSLEVTLPLGSVQTGPLLCSMSLGTRAQPGSLYDFASF